MNMNFMIGALASMNTPPIGERVAEGFEIFVLGMLMVFAVLALLWGVLAIFKIVFYDIPQKKKENAERAADQAVKAEDTKPAPVAVAPIEDNGAIVAAITAALTAYFAESGEYSGGFRVVSFRKSQTRSAWNKK